MQVSAASREEQSDKVSRCMVAFFNWLTRRTDRLTGPSRSKTMACASRLALAVSKREATTVTESTAGRRHQHSPTSLAGGAHRHREAEKIFDFGEFQHRGVRVSAVQIFVQRPVFGWHVD